MKKITVVLYKFSCVSHPPLSCCITSHMQTSWHKAGNAVCTQSKVACLLSTLVAWASAEWLK